MTLHVPSARTSSNFSCLFLGEAETGYGQQGGWEIPTDHDPDSEEARPIPAGGRSYLPSISQLLRA